MATDLAQLPIIAIQYHVAILFAVKSGLTVLLMLALGFSSIGASAQTATHFPAIPPGANTFLIPLADSRDSIWVHTGQLLFKHGYVVKYSDKSLGIIVTDNKLLYPNIYQLVVTVQVTNHMLALRGRYGNYAVAFGDRPNSRIEVMWRELDQLAHEMGSPVVYLTQ